MKNILINKIGGLIMLKFKVANHNDFGRMRYALNKGEVVFSTTDLIKCLGLPN